MESSDQSDEIWIICMNKPIIQCRTRCWKQVMCTDWATQITVWPIKWSSMLCYL